MSVSRDAAELLFRVAELERKLSNVVRDGKVIEVDEKKGMARVDLGTKKQPLPTDWIRWGAQAGAIRIWQPLSVGQHVKVISTSGDIGQGFIMPGSFNDQFPDNHDKKDEVKISLGKSTVHVKGDQIETKTDKATVTQTADGKITSKNDKAVVNIAANGSITSTNQKGTSTIDVDGTITHESGGGKVVVALGDVLLNCG